MYECSASKPTYTTTAAGSIPYQVPFALKNVKALFFVFRCSDNLNFTPATARDGTVPGDYWSQYSLSNRASLGITQSQLSVNGLVLPANRFQQIESITPTLAGISYPHYFMQAQKTFGN